MEQKRIWIFGKAEAEIPVADIRKNPVEGIAFDRDTDPETIKIFESEAEALEALRRQESGAVRCFTHLKRAYALWVDYYAEEATVAFDPAEESWEEAYECGAVDYPGVASISDASITLDAEDEDGIRIFEGKKLPCKTMREAWEHVAHLPAKTEDGAEIAYTVYFGGVAVD